MCVEWTGEWEVAAADITAYKFVRRDGKHYRSPVAVQDRDGQQQQGTRGAVLTYKIGRKTDGDEPGIYCVTTPVRMENNINTKKEDMVVLEVVIPKGTRFRRGRAGLQDNRGRTVEIKTLNAMSIKVVRECDEEDVYPALWPTKPQYVGNKVWNYVNASTTTFIACNVSTTWGNVD